MHFFYRHRVLSAAAGAALGLSLFAGAASAQASSLTSTQIQAVISLLQAFNVDPSTIATVQGVLNGTSTSTTTAQDNNHGDNNEQGNHNGPGVCGVLMRSLHPGDRDGGPDGDVSKLQEFLGTSVTGFFGSTTQQMLQQWQAEHGVVSGGSPSTTGFGAFGPRTRGLLNQEIAGRCGQGFPGGMQGSTTMPLGSTTTSWMHDRGGDQ